MEEWKDIDDTYIISNYGRVVDKITKKQLKPYKLRDGYLYVKLGKKFKAIHRLVAIAFIQNTENKKEVNHIDGNKENNHSYNLEWTTPKENIKHAWENGLIKSHNTRSKGIYYSKLQQLDKDGNIIKIWNSQKEASKELKIGATNISKVCNNRTKTAGGFKWKYIQEGVIK